MWIYLFAISALLMARKARGVGATPRHTFGGNRGYKGYSMSWRAVEARRDGKFPKGDFCKVYHITPDSLNLLVECRLIDDTEWHHTSKFGNRTTFFEWMEPYYQIMYEDNKRYIDDLSKKYKQLRVEQDRYFTEHIEAQKQGLSDTETLTNEWMMKNDKVRTDLSNIKTDIVTLSDTYDEKYG